MYRQYDERNRLLHTSLDNCNGGDWLEVPRESSGLYTHLRLPRTVNLDRLMKRLAGSRVTVVTGKRFYWRDYRDRDNFLRIFVSRADSQRIEEGIRIMIREINKCIGK